MPCLLIKCAPGCQHNFVYEGNCGVFAFSKKFNVNQNEPDIKKTDFTWDDATNWSVESLIQI